MHNRPGDHPEGGGGGGAARFGTRRDPKPFGGREGGGVTVGGQRYAEKSSGYLNSEKANSAVSKARSGGESNRTALLKETAAHLESLVRSGNAGMGAFCKLQDIRVSIKSAANVKLGRKLAE